MGRLDRMLDSVVSDALEYLSRPYDADTRLSQLCRVPRGGVGSTSAS